MATLNQDVHSSIDTLMQKGTGDSPDDNANGPSEKWQKEINLAEKDLRKFWERGRRVVRKYIDESEQTSAQIQDVDRYNVFWANVGVLKASLYANAPKPLVKREWDDYMDQVARVASVMMERLLNQGFEKPTSDMNIAFKQTVDDRLIPGLGQVWLTYEPEIETTEIQPAVLGKRGTEITPAVTSEQIVDEFVITDYIFWEDFLWSPCRTWEECRWVAKRAWLSKSEFKARFGARFMTMVSWTKKEPSKYGERITPESMGIEKTEVFELWHKPSLTVHWISKSCEYELDSQGDPLELENFFPCPKPLLATHTTASLVPKADYLMVQSQYRRLDNLSRRIGMLEDAIQASGVYDKANKELGQLLSGNNNKMIPVENWAMFAEGGGMKGVVDWFPLEMIVNALEKLRMAKEAAKVELFELTGISDIMRGTTAPRETLGAQELKSQYSSVRLQYLQGEVAEFIQEALRIKAEIITKHFQIETIIKNSLIEMTPDADQAVEAAQLLKDEWASCYRVQVFADTLAIPDYNAERAGRTEFIGTMGQFISQVAPLMEQVPEAGPFLLQILQWGVSSFRSAATIEGVFSKAVTGMLQKLQQQQQNPQQPPPDPKMVVANAQAQAIQQKTQVELQRKQTETQTNQGRAASELQKDQMITQAKVQDIQTGAKMDTMTTMSNIQLKKAKTQAEIRNSRAKTAAQISAQRKAKETSK